MTETAVVERESIAPETHMGVVTLRVKDLDAMTAYYRDVITLDVLSSTADTVTLGRGSNPVVRLEHAPELRLASPGQAGLFHTAILFETQTALAAAVLSVATKAPGTFTGSSDHLVSQAFYFTDPEGNGIELYWDRERSAWGWNGHDVAMDTLYLDPNAFLQEHLTPEAMENPSIGGTTVGHVHLSIGDIATAREFYVNQIGFDQTLNFHGSALFVSAGGYHHHMGLNIWNSRGASRRQLTLGLGQVDIHVPDSDALGATLERLTHFGNEVRDDGQTLFVDDPWGNLLRITAAA
jgi:catechol 2,3-dioxygenase